jgi:hypothetical protein
MYGYVPLSLIIDPADPHGSARLFHTARPPFANSLDFVLAHLWPRPRRAHPAAPQPEPIPSCRCDPCPPISIPVTR